MRRGSLSRLLSRKKSVLWNLSRGFVARRRTSRQILNLISSSHPAQSACLDFLSHAMPLLPAHWTKDPSAPEGLREYWSFVGVNAIYYSIFLFQISVVHKHFFTPIACYSPSCLISQVSWLERGSSVGGLYCGASQREKRKARRKEAIYMSRTRQWSRDSVMTYHLTPFQFPKQVSSRCKISCQQFGGKYEWSWRLASYFSPTLTQTKSLLFF